MPAILQAWRSSFLALGGTAAVALAVLASCARPAASPPPDAGAGALGSAPAPLRTVFFGSSTTEGAGATRLERRWTSILSRRLGWIEVNRGLSASTLTRVGSRVPSAEERWREALAGDPDVVFVMYGANDVTAHVPLGDPDTPGTFRHAAAAVLRGIRAALPLAVIVVCSPQPSRATAAGRAPYDLALEEAAANAGALFVPAGTAFSEERLAALSADALHLNDAGHAVLAEFLVARERSFHRRGAASR